MTQDLLNRRRQSYALNTWEDVNLPYFVDYSDIAQQTIHFFKTESQLIYPAKSYFVAIVYSKCLEHYFQMDFYSSLNDPQLIFDDRFFTIYENSREIYDEILENIQQEQILSMSSTQKTVSFFKREFLICN